MRKDVEILAVCDPSTERAEEVRQRFGAKFAFTNLSEILELSQLDAVSVCTPNQFHAEMSIEALKAGKHVLCKKPMATTLESAKAMIEAANKKLSLAL
jgi:predicted dehydrogenase